MDGGSTPLFIAAEEGHEAVVRALIDLGADINKARDDGATPL
jgi:NLR family CARD domain-containing protein 3